jgi:hypothetical protein
MDLDIPGLPQAPKRAPARTTPRPARSPAASNGHGPPVVNPYAHDRLVQLNVMVPEGMKRALSELLAELVASGLVNRRSGNLTALVSALAHHATVLDADAVAVLIQQWAMVQAAPPGPREDASA